MFQPVFKGEESHGEKASEWAIDNLEKIGFPKHKIKQVAYAVKVHSNKPGLLDKNDVEACILWDADKLTKINSYTLLFNFFTKVFAKDQIENINDDEYRTGQMTISELIENETRSLINEDIIEYFYFNVSNERANKLRNINNSFIKR